MPRPSEDAVFIRNVDNFAIVGFDNVAVGVYAEVPLSTIDQDTSKAGRDLVSKLLDSSGHRGPDDDRIPAELIIRASCGAP